MSVDVAIVGAGAAGVGAARRLAAAGLSVTVIEASDRVGGRAHTRDLDGLALDMGCGWLHSAERNPWVGIAEAAGLTVDRTEAAWGRQWHDLGFPAADHREAECARAAFERRLAETPPPSDRAADALEPGGRWTAWLQALSGFLNGAELERVSVADYLAYDTAASEHNWRVREGYGRLVAASLPPVALRLSTPVTAIRLDGGGVALDGHAGTFRAQAVIVTVSTAVLARGGLRLPREAEDHAHAAVRLPLGLDDKLFFAIDDPGLLEAETALIGDPHDPETASFYIRPLGAPVVESFLGGPGARARGADGVAAAFDAALAQLCALLGSDARRKLRPLAASAWSRERWVGGAYSHALPGEAGRRAELARPVAERLFFAGEATHPTDFSTAHGALASGERAADEVLAALRPSLPAA